MCDNSLNVWQAPDLLVRDGEEQAGVAWAAMAQDLLTAGRNPSPDGNEAAVRLQYDYCTCDEEG